MTISEKVAYIKGLAEGMELDTDSKEGKILSAIIDVLGDMCDEIDALDEAQVELAEQLDAVDEDLSDVETIIYEDDDEYDDDEYEDDDEVYEVVCPECGDKIYLDEDMLLDGRVDCPNCGTDLEFEFDCNCDCDDCDCDDCDCDDCVVED
ncbi:MAG: hypothetical protein E7526_00655 [Ruminococcaceae bacterium]|nr:hypothetical protein [Oscillospiraceae bacterium]